MHAWQYNQAVHVSGAGQGARGAGRQVAAQHHVHKEALPLSILRGRRAAARHIQLAGCSGGGGAGEYLSRHAAGAGGRTWMEEATGVGEMRGRGEEGAGKGGEGAQR